MLLRTCALIALIAFAQFALAQEEGGDEMEAKEEVKKTDGDGVLDSRYGGKSWSGGKGGNRGGGRGSNDDDDDEDGNDGGSGFRGGNSGGSGSNIGLNNNLVTNKVVAGTVSELPTVRTSSRRRRVLASVKRNLFRQNSASNVLQKNIIKQKKIHTSLDVTVHKPLTVNTYKKHHHTQYVIKTQPILTKVNVEQKQDIYQPAKKNVIIRTSSENVRKITLPAIVRYQNRADRLKTIWEATRNLGTVNKGSVLNAGSANLGSGGLGGSKYGNYNNNYNNDNDYGKGGSSLGYRAAEVPAEVPAEAVAAPAAEAVAAPAAEEQQ